MRQDAERETATPGAGAPETWQLEAMSRDQRAELARRLAALEDPLPAPDHAVRRARRLFLDLMVVCTLGLIPWTVMLAFTLPHHYVAGHWAAAWVGLDVALLAGLGTTAWSAWRRRQLVVASAIVTATLLVTDAWFDVLTASSTDQQILSSLNAVLVELPLAGILALVAMRLSRLTTRAARALAGDEDLDPPLWKVPLFVIDDPRAVLARRGGALPGTGGS